MNHYLLYDSGCSRCTALATDIERVAEGRLGIRSLRDADVTALLEHYAPDHKWEPMALETNGDQVRVYGGIAMRAKLVQVLGIRTAWLVARLVRKADGPVFSLGSLRFKIRTLMTSSPFGILLGGSPSDDFMPPCNCHVESHPTCAHFDLRYNRCDVYCEDVTGEFFCMSSWYCTNSPC